MTPAPSQPARRRGFTLFELILALAILMLVAGAVFTLTGAAVETAQAAREEQADSRRMERFLRVLRDTFQGLDGKGRVFLRADRRSTSPVQELVFEGVSNAFGLATLGDASLVLAPLPQSDGSRTFSIRIVPVAKAGALADQEIPWTPLLGGIERVRWGFYSRGAWVEEWEQGQGRPELVRLTFDRRTFSDPVEAVFWIPPVTATPVARKKADPDTANPPAVEVTPPAPNP
jgi:type II secretory pathway pseudopilin PulG